MHYIELTCYSNLDDQRQNKFVRNIKYSWQTYSIQKYKGFKFSIQKYKVTVLSIYCILQNGTKKNEIYNSLVLLPKKKNYYSIQCFGIELKTKDLNFIRFINHKKKPVQKIVLMKIR